MIFYNVCLQTFLTIVLVKYIEKGDDVGRTQFYKKDGLISVQINIFTTLTISNNLQYLFDFQNLNI